MLVISILSRISSDKNWFLDIVHLAHYLKKNSSSKFEINFIGAIDNQVVFENIKNQAFLLDVDSNIKFSKSSIPIEKLPEQIKNGYFINFVVGSFLGYSSIECLKLNFKTFFYNVDPEIEEGKHQSISICHNINQLCHNILQLIKNRQEIDKLILESNNSLRKNYELSDNDKILLKLIIAPS